MPIGFTRNGMPHAMQLVARPFQESLLFRVGAAYEAVAERADWPPL
jgi:Asp-tRNA(Asn)/Glu-tRNA(Gln) amidotransferase A subunit family amidase